MAGVAILSSDLAAVAAGATFGAISRFQAGELAAQWIAKDPTKRTPFQGWHTAGINIAGSFALGSLAGTPTFTSPKTDAVTTQKFSGLSPRAKLMMGVGFCGSFTTFSTFSVDVAKWMAEGQIQKATSYVLANNVGGVVAAAAGMLIMKKFFGP